MLQTRVSFPAKYLGDVPSNFSVGLDFGAEDLDKCDGCDLFHIGLRGVASRLGRSSLEGSYDVTVKNVCDEAMRRAHGCGIGEFTVERVAHEPETLPLPEVFTPTLVSV